MKHLILVLFLSGLFATQLLAESDYFMGTEVGSSARGIRIANIEGFSNVADSVFENPAALSRMDTLGVSLFSAQLIGEVTYYNVAGLLPTPFGNIGMGFNSVGVADLIRTKLENEGTVFESISELGTFSVNKSVYKLGYSIAQSKNVRFGVGMSYYTTSIAEFYGTGFNVDTGIIYETDQFALSLLLRNVASSLKVNYNNGSSENLPLETVVSSRIKMDDFSLMGQFKILGSSKKLAKSAALNYNPSFIPIIHLSGGYKEFPVLRDIKSKVVMGVGIDLLGSNVDYAFEASEHPEYSGIHYFSFSINF
ncbi:hypothetical protein EBR96_03440 [bacterium]|nr:hypothetical protein [bacterium]